jgi:peptide/nickel transport system permease protein
MLGYILCRVGLVIPVMLVVAVVVFSLLYFTPGDPALIIAGDQATAADIAKIRVALGLDQPPYIRFWSWLASIAHGDLGLSIFTGQSVRHMISQRLEPTLSLLGLSVLISVGLGVPFGIAAARRKGGFADRCLTVFMISSLSVPIFVTGYILAFVFASWLRWLPVQGFSPLEAGIGAYLSKLLLPASTLSFLYAALIAGVTRTSMLAVLSQDYIRTAVAKGAGELRILFGHALKNAAIPIVTIIGSGVATLIGGAVVIENVFAIPGLGRLTVDSIMHRDYPVIQGVVLLSSAAYVVVNLIVDVSYAVLDPRIRY